MANNANHVKMLILGSGPAGFSAALYAARAELAPVVLTGTQLGGQAALTYTIENYPGFPDGVGGAQLGELFQKQAEHFGTRVEFDTANKVDLSATTVQDHRPTPGSTRRKRSSSPRVPARST